MTPRVSVLLASRDGARFLEGALESLADQTWPDVEVVAVDDGSKDGTAARLEAFAARHPRTRLLATGGIGLAGALALAAREATGELLARQDDDDVSRPERLERQIRHLVDHPEIVVVGTGADVIDAVGRVIGSYPVPLSPRAIRRTLRRAPPFVHGSVVMRRAAYEAAGGYRAAFGASQDLDLWLRMPEEAGLANLAEPLYAWRRHPGGVFARARGEQLFFTALARTFRDERAADGTDSLALLERSPDREAFLARYPHAARLLATLGEICVREGRVAEARRHLIRAMRGGERGALAWWLMSWPVGFTPRARRARAGLDRADAGALRGAGA